MAKVCGNDSRELRLYAVWGARRYRFIIDVVFFSCVIVGRSFVLSAGVLGAFFFIESVWFNRELKRIVFMVSVP